MTHDATSPRAGGRSSRRPFWLAVLALGLMCATVGLVLLLTHLGRQRNPAAQTDAGALEVLHYPVEKLSALAGYLSDLDEGRLQAAPPVDWYIAPRDQDYVARFVFDRSRQSPLPRITIEARDAKFRQPRDVSEANLPEFLKRFAGSLDSDTRQAVEGSFLTLVLGDVPCVAYQTQRKFRVGNGEFLADREVLVTLRNGRLYEVTLDVRAGQLDDFRADAWAVMAGMQFPQPPASGETQPAADKANENAERAGGAAEAGKADAAPADAH